MLKELIKNKQLSCEERENRAIDHTHTTPTASLNEMFSQFEWFRLYTCSEREKEGGRERERKGGLV